MSTDVDPAFEQLLEHVRDSRGFDFTGYKRASLMRRVHKRMQEVGIDAFSDYQDHLEVDPEEFNSLFNTILINITSFFRDPESWEFLAEEVVPRIVEQTRGRGPLRVWSVGCASGEEAYSLAMTIAEAVGPEELRAGVKIYATDVDEEALEQARAGTYPATAIESIPPELREKYLQPSTDGFIVKKELRRTVIFGRHDLVHDAPISRVSLIVPEHAHLLQRGDPNAHLQRVPLRAPTRWIPAPRQVGDASHPNGHLRAGRSQATGVLPRVGRTRPRGAGPASRRRALSGVDQRAAPRRGVRERDDRSGRSRCLRHGGGCERPRSRAVRSGRFRHRTPVSRARALVQADRAAFAHRPGGQRGALERRAGSGLGRRRRSKEVPRRRGHPDLRERRSARHEHHVHRRHPSVRHDERARGLAERARGDVRADPVDRRGARDDERGAGDDERGAPVDERGARDHERGALFDELGARDRQRRAPRPHESAEPGELVLRVGHGEHASRRRRPRSRSDRRELELARRGHVGAAC